MEDTAIFRRENKSPNDDRTLTGFPDHSAAAALTNSSDRTSFGPSMFPLGGNDNLMEMPSSQPYFPDVSAPTPSIPNGPNAGPVSGLFGEVVIPIPLEPAGSERSNVNGITQPPAAHVVVPVTAPSSVMIPMEFVEKILDWQSANLKAVPTRAATGVPPSDAKNRLSQQLTGIPTHVIDQLVQMEVENVEDIRLLLQHPEDLQDVPVLHRRKLEVLVNPKPDKEQKPKKNNATVQPRDLEKGRDDTTSPPTVRQKAPRVKVKNEISDGTSRDSGADSSSRSGSGSDGDAEEINSPVVKRAKKTGAADAKAEGAREKPVKKPDAMKPEVSKSKPDKPGGMDRKQSKPEDEEGIELQDTKKVVREKTKDEPASKKSKEKLTAPVVSGTAAKGNGQLNKKQVAVTNTVDKKKDAPKPKPMKSLDTTAVRTSGKSSSNSHSDSDDHGPETDIPSKTSAKHKLAEQPHEKEVESKPAATAESPLLDQKKNGKAVLNKKEKAKTKKKTPFWRRCCFGKKEDDVSDADLKKEIEMDDHLVPEDELFKKLDVNPEQGLSASEASKRLQRDGKNALKPPKQLPEILKFFSELFSGFSPLLLAGAALALIAWGVQYSQKSGESVYDNLYLGAVLVAVVLISGGFLYLQKRKSEQIMASFKNMLPQHAKVLRDGNVKEVDAESLVLGDIVILKAGDAVPADLRVLSSENMKVDNSSLTGESEPQPRSTEATENPLESENLCFYSSNVVEGSGRGVIILRGEDTVLGRIAALTLSVDDSETTIAKEIRAFVKLVSIFACITGIICCVVPLALGFDVIDTTILAIGLIVANVPEGVVIAVTVMLTLTAKRMAKKNCLVKTLEAVETLGSCSIICSDKTGTLTQNKMTVAHCWVDNKLIEIDAKVHGDQLPDSHTMEDLIRVATLCNHAEFVAGGRKSQQSVSKKKVVGDASETALLRFVEAARGESAELRDDYEVVLDVPFNSTTKFQVSIHETQTEGQKRYLMVMKGAPEQIWAKCTTILAKGKEQEIDDEWDERFKRANLRLGQLGERVLGFCDFWLPESDYPVPTEFDAEEKNFPDEGLRFIGLIAMIDPPRPAVGQAILRSRSAGIRILMVTGDQPVTAEAIARYVGIISDDAIVDTPDDRAMNDEEGNSGRRRAMVIHGQEQLKQMDSDDLDDILRNYQEIVFARTSPQQKLVIVDACQRTGAIVAVTGDGVNDSPALKQSNIGIAMGITGSDVSKQAADMVLLDDNFSSIITGIEEGRLIFDNLKKTICYSIMSNIPEIMPVLAFIVLNIPLALTVIPMLLLCLVTDMLPSISLAYEKPEGNIMAYPPRNINDRLVNSRLIHCAYLQAGVIASAGAFFAYFVVFGENGFLPKKLFGIRAEWVNPQLDVVDSFGQQWNYRQRMNLQHSANTAYFVAVVVFQLADLVCRKVRRLSVFQQGMRNWFLNAALLFEIGCAAFLVYTPYLNEAFSLRRIKFLWWLPVLPFMLFFFLFDELRRCLIRLRPVETMETVALHHAAFPESLIVAPSKAKRGRGCKRMPKRDPTPYYPRRSRSMSPAQPAQTAQTAQPAQPAQAMPPAQAIHLPVSIQPGQAEMVIAIRIRGFRLENSHYFQTEMADGTFFIGSPAMVQEFLRTEPEFLHSMHLLEIRSMEHAITQYRYLCHIRGLDRDLSLWLTHEQGILAYYDLFGTAGVFAQHILNFVNPQQ